MMYDILYQTLVVTINFKNMNQCKVPLRILVNEPELSIQDQVCHSLTALWRHRVPSLLCSWSGECQDQPQSNWDPIQEYETTNE